MKRLIISGSPRARGRSAGVAEAVRFAFEDACAYANQREQFGQQIGRFELVQEMIMEVMELLGRGEEEHYDAET